MNIKSGWIMIFGKQFVSKVSMTCLYFEQPPYIFFDVCILYTKAALLPKYLENRCRKAHDIRHMMQMT